MKTKTAPARAVSLRLYFRIRRGPEIAFGPGKAELLALIGETGSINQAAKRMGMSYMRAWSLVQTMNRSFKQPLVLATPGGTGGGGAELSGAGKRMLALYRQTEERAAQSTRLIWKQMLPLLKP